MTTSHSKLIEVGASICQISVLSNVYPHGLRTPISKIGPMWQTKYASAVPKNLVVGVNFRPCSEDYFLSGRPKSVL